MKNLQIIIRIILLLTINTVFGQNPMVNVVFRFQEAPSDEIRIKYKDQYPQKFKNIKSNQAYTFRYSGILGHYETDTLKFLDTNDKVMEIIFKINVKHGGHFDKIYFDIPKFKASKTTVLLNVLFKDDCCSHYTPSTKYTWKTAISRYKYESNKNFDTSFVQIRNTHPLLSPSDTLTFLLNGSLMTDGSCNDNLFFEIFKVTKDSLFPTLVSPGFTPSLCSMGFKSFIYNQFMLPSLYAKNHYYGQYPINIDSGDYIFCCQEIGKRRGNIFSDTIHFNTILKTDRSNYKKSDSIHISFKTIKAFGLQVTNCGPSTTYHINLEQFNEKNQKWETLGYALPPPLCLAIYHSISTESPKLELTIPIPYKQYTIKYPSKHRLSAIVSENRFNIYRHNCRAKTVYSDEFTIEN